MKETIENEILTRLRTADGAAELCAMAVGISLVKAIVAISEDVDIEKWNLGSCGKRVILIRSSDTVEGLIANAMRPTEVEGIQIFDELTRAVVFTHNDRELDGISRSDEGTALAAKVTGWDLIAVSRRQFEDVRRRAVDQYRQHPDISSEFAFELVGLGCFSFGDLGTVDSGRLAELGRVSLTKAAGIIRWADQMADQGH